MAKKDNYISARESRRISRENRKITAAIEKKRNRKNIPESEYVTQMKNPDNCVEFDNVHTYFFTDIGTVKAVDGVSFEVPTGKTVGIVGESGCGKSVTSLSLMQLVQRPSGQTVEGEIRFNTGDKAINVVNAPASYMQKLRGNSMGMIFQEPMTSLNPVFRIGDQVDEVIKLHNPDMSADDVKARTLEMLQLVGIANKEGVYKMYPHELSGGMRQRVMIAMALACDPKLIIADEPTTALDVTIQAQILQLLKDLQKEFHYTIVFITHDLGVVANIADRVAVLYAGQIVEYGTVDEVFYDPHHPYTWALLSSLPQLAKPNEELFSITGTPPSLYNDIQGDPFAPRNQYALKIDSLKEPPMFKVTDTHYAKTWLLDPRSPKVEKPKAIGNIHETLIKAFNI
jgi:peptide/nickel transport system ATP-binding protein